MVASLPLLVALASVRKLMCIFIGSLSLGFPLMRECVDYCICSAGSCIFETSTDSITLLTTQINITRLYELDEISFSSCFRYLTNNRIRYIANDTFIQSPQLDHV